MESYPTAAVVLARYVSSW